jgi:hypothetical protein
MSPAFSPTRYVISTRRKAKRELLLLPAMNDTIGQLDQPEFCTTFQRDNCGDISEFESYMLSHAVGLRAGRNTLTRNPTAEWLAR